MKWEYRVEYFGVQDDPDHLEKFLNIDLGEEGWELVTVVAYSDNRMGRAFFKRPISEVANYVSGLDEVKELLGHNG